MSNDIIGHGKVVYITYSVLDEDGKIMGQQDMPTGYVHGAGSGLFPAVERALEGRQPGDAVKAEVSPEEGFGPSDPNLIIVDEIDHVPPTIRYIGAEAELQNDAGEKLSFRVINIADGKITLDGNNPLAGRTATIVATVVSVRDAVAEELNSGFPAEQGPPPLH
ncbi:MAG: peptidylprolyl isomerase [Pseudomonadota bacterium]|nr:peptidylprolyl isomerase [Pseudomonadota bacterium]MDP1902832.1 peptidylprolyl isomerase [Pseudomonadota bacterium]MDP2353432.1 peptidylprolyl isomerase [Pseudomonadota bacterium]